MKPLYFFINTVNQNRPSFAVFDDNGHILYSYEFVGRQEGLAQRLSDFFKKQKIQSAEIKAVLTISGPGSFSASRAGIVLANSLNFVNKTPVLSVQDKECGTEELIKNNLNTLKGIKKTAVGEVYYQKEPDIAVKK